MRVLVTGATGFVGRQLMEELLAREVSVRALVRDADKAPESWRRAGVELVVGDVRDASALTAALRDVEVIQHCAAAVGPHFSRRQIYETNLHGVRNVLDAARMAGHARVVLVSSINVLGTRSLQSATEDLPCRRSNDPAADVKIEAETLALDYGRQGLHVTIVRPGFIYGPGDPHNLPKIVRALERGKFAFIGSRLNVVPIVHVRDVAQALVLAGASQAAGRIYHISDGTRTTIGEFIDCLVELLGCAPPQRVLPYAIPYVGCLVFEALNRLKIVRQAPINRAGLRFLGTSRYVDISRARRELGYEPRFTIREGLAEALAARRQESKGAVHVASGA